ncbi:hypothetical protein TNCV_4838471 [Trichonephila clavipes]|nr:hypothetical protein TNCV_4838471 [Trichonephila clavipes]
MPLKIIRFLTFLRERHQRMRQKLFSRKFKRIPEEDVSDSTEEESIEMEFSSETADSHKVYPLRNVEIQRCQSKNCWKSATDVK